MKAGLGVQSDPQIDPWLARELWSEMVLYGANRESLRLGMHVLWLNTHQSHSLISIVLSSFPVIAHHNVM